MKTEKNIAIFGIGFLVFGAVLGLSMFNQKTLENPEEEWRAKLFIRPEEKTFIIDEDFQATVNVETNMEINTAGIKIHFPMDKLEVIDLSKEESIFELWVQEPTYSNIDGTIEFSGGLPTPGFKGNQGKILTITFRAKKEGRADIKFEEGLVLANDGEGTDILKEMKGASFTLIGLGASDLNNDTYINIYDLSILLTNWGIPKNPKADINQDGQVGIADFSILLFNLAEQFLSE